MSKFYRSVPVTSRLLRSIGMRRAAHSLLPFGSHDPNLRKDVDRCCTKSVASVSNAYAAGHKSMSRASCVHQRAELRLAGGKKLSNKRERDKERESRVSSCTYLQRARVYLFIGCDKDRNETGNRKVQANRNPKQIGNEEIWYLSALSNTRTKRRNRCVVAVSLRSSSAKYESPGHVV